MGWIILGAMATAVFAVLWRFGRLTAAGLQITGTALLLGAAGYAWQAKPGMAGSPHVPPGTVMQEDSPFAVLRSTFMGRFGSDNQWLDFADAMHRAGNDPYAVKAVLTGLDKNPKSSILWVGLGNALTLANEGQVTPPAQFAFDRAAELAPGTPGPPFFLGLALIQEGKLDEGAALWRQLLATSPANVSWREAVAIRLAMVDRLREAQ